jgi:acetyl esterase/lipase
MVMGARAGVKSASTPMTAFAVAGLAAQLLNALASIPFRRPWQGPETIVHNVGITVTRTVMRAFLGYATSLPTAEFRSLERALDGICRIALPPFLRRLGVVMHETAVAGINGLRYQRELGEPTGTILYLHGGGYIGTSPAMYTIFAGRLAHETGCAVFVPDYRLAPEFPFPYSLDDVIAVYRGLLESGVRPDRLFVAGDSGGGGLMNALLLDPRPRSLPPPAGLLFFSPEVSLTLDEPSITENAGRDILPWNVPVWPYLHRIDPQDPSVSALHANVDGFPPTLWPSAATRCSAMRSAGSSHGCRPPGSRRLRSRSATCSTPSRSSCRGRRPANASIAPSVSSSRGSSLVLIEDALEDGTR